VNRTWNWIDDGVLPYGLAALRATWIWTLLWLWARLIVPPRPELASPWMVVLLLVVSTMVAQVASFRLQGIGGAILVVSGGLIAVAVTVFGLFGFALTDDIFAMLFVLVVAAWCWRWGILAGSEALTFETCLNNFVYGIVALVFGVMVTILAHANLLREFVFLILLYFAIGLGMLALASVREAQAYDGTARGGMFGLSRYWLGTVATVVGILLVVGFVIGGVFDPTWTQQVMRAAATAYEALAQIILIVAVVVVFVFLAVVEFIAQLLQIKSLDLPLPNFDVILRLVQFAPQPSDSGGDIPPWLYVLARIGAAALIIGLLIALFAYAFRRFRRQRVERTGETHESVLTLGLLQEQLRKLFQRAEAGHAAPAPYVEIQGDEPRAQIRRIYQQLLALAAERGVKRMAGQTPTEFARALQVSLRLASEPLGIITGAYMQARYDAAAVTHQDAERVAQAWQELSRAATENQSPA
jgi:Domain of unknown function (DUF4129)